jgi:hypothetical protein
MAAFGGKDSYMRCIVNVALLGALILIGGCDDRSSNTNPPAQTTPPPANPAEPTTQELLSAPRHRLSLSPFAPLNLEVPDSWKVNSMDDGKVVFLEGPSPSDTIHILLSPRRVMNGNELAYLQIGAKKEQAENPSTVRIIDFRPLGSSTLFERLTLLPSAATQVSTTAPVASTEPTGTLRWSCTVFIPAGDQYHSYELVFTGLNTSQYATDETFLRSIMKTLAVEPEDDTRQP